MPNTRPLVAALLISALSACKLAGSLTAGSAEVPSHTPTAQETAPPAAATPAQPRAQAKAPAPAPPPRAAGPVMATKQQYDAYHALADRHQKVLRRLAKLDEGGLHGLPARPSSAAEELRALASEVEAFAEFADSCAAYLDLRITDLAEYEEPRVACRDLGRVDSLIATMASDAVRWFADQKEQAWRGRLETLRKGYPIADDKLTALVDMKAEVLREQLAAELEELSGLAGTELEWEELFVDLEAERDEVLAAAPEASAEFRYRRSAPGQVARVARQLLADARYRNTRPRVVAVLARDADWQVSANRYTGVPVARTHRVQVVAKIDSEPFCRMYELDVSQRHHGGGRWSKPATAGVETGPRVTSCKK